MRLSLIFCLTFIALNGCGKDGRLKLHNDSSEDPRAMHGIETLLLPHVETFERLYGKPVQGIPVNFKDIKFAGECRKYANGYKEVFIDPDLVELVEHSHPTPLTEVEKTKLYEQAVLHELGHCVLDRDHIEERMIIKSTNVSIPASIMHPNYFGHEDFYRQFRSYYQEELISPKMRRNQIELPDPLYQ